MPNYKIRSLTSIPAFFNQIVEADSPSDALVLLCLIGNLPVGSFAGILACDETSEPADYKRNQILFKRSHHPTLTVCESVSYIAPAACEVEPYGSQIVAYALLRTLGAGMKLGHISREEINRVLDCEARGECGCGCGSTKEKSDADAKHN